MNWFLEFFEKFFVACVYVLFLLFIFISAQLKCFISCLPTSNQPTKKKKNKKIVYELLFLVVFLFLLKIYSVKTFPSRFLFFFLVFAFCLPPSSAFEKTEDCLVFVAVVVVAFCAHKLSPHKFIGILLAILVQKIGMCFTFFLFFFLTLLFFLVLLLVPEHQVSFIWVQKNTRNKATPKTNETKAKKLKNVVQE